MSRILFSFLLVLPVLAQAPAPAAKKPSPPAPPASAKAAPADAYPDPSKTPGWPNPDITQDQIAQNICSKTWTTSTIRPTEDYTTKLKLQQMKDLGLTGKEADYEEDHFISLEIGGNPSDPRNLWPEPWNLKVGANDYGAHTKDFVENFLHDEVCFSVPNHKVSSGDKYPAKTSITLVQAQQIITQDWYACFQKMQAGQPCK
jgi:hypothetical protein